MRSKRRSREPSGTWSSRQVNSDHVAKWSPRHIPLSNSAFTFTKTDHFAKFYVATRPTILQKRSLLCLIGWFRGFFVELGAGVDGGAGEKGVDQVNGPMELGHGANDFYGASVFWRATWV